MDGCTRIATLASTIRLTFVIVSHDLRSLEPLIDRAVAMTYGTKVAEGSFREVMDDEGFKSAYLGQEAF